MAFVKVTFEFEDEFDAEDMAEQYLNYCNECEKDDTRPLDLDDWLCQTLEEIENDEYCGCGDFSLIDSNALEREIAKYLENMEE